MLKETLLKIFERDLNQLKDEINLYSNESKLWIVREEISNSAGNLCLHLTGNLNHFIGTLLGNSDYMRDRNGEFSTKYVTRAELTNQIEKTIEIVKNTLDKLPSEDFEKDFPEIFRGDTVKTDFMLVHLLTHFNYHLGQINYHRRLIS